MWKDVAGIRTHFWYSDEGLVGEYDAVGTEIRTYGWKPRSIWSTDPLFMKQGAKYYYYHNDHLGTPQKMTSANGAVVWSGTYSSFGKAEIDSGSTVTNNLRFPGQYRDEETGLHYNFQRYYDAEGGRYLRTDPIRLAGGIALYVYVMNNPGNWTDPWGLWTYATEYGTTGTGLTDPMTSIEDAVDQAYIDAGGDNAAATVTFTTNGTHTTPNSLHYSGNAIDLRVWGLTDAERADWVRRIRDAIGYDYDVVDEGDHIHVEYDPDPCE